MKWLTLSILFISLAANAVPKKGCKDDLNGSLEYYVVNDALRELGFAQIPRPTQMVDHVTLKVMDPTKSAVARYIFDQRRLIPQLEFIASAKPPAHVADLTEWEEGDGIAVGPKVYARLREIFEPETLLTVLKHETVHAADYQRCVAFENYEDCAKKIIFSVLEGEPFPHLPAGYNKAFSSDEFEAFVHEFNLETRGTKNRFRDLQRSLVPAALAKLATARRTSSRLPVVHAKYNEIPFVEFTFTWENRIILASVPYYMGPKHSVASIEYLVRMFTTRELQLKY